MTAPTSPDGKFATVQDVIDRFEKPVPDGDKVRISRRIGDVESDLMGLVPSLRKDVDQIQADSDLVGDPDRMKRVKSLVCNKVLELYRNPDGSSQVSQTMEGDSVSRSYWRNQDKGAIDFTESELARVKLRRRPNKIGTIMVQPWNPPCR